MAICADGLLTLLPEIVRHARIPVCASGGFVPGAGVVAALALGAAGIRCGTLFLPTHKSFAQANHKQRILAALGQYRLHRFVCYQLNAAFACARAVEQPYRKGQDLLAPHHPNEPPREVISNDDGRPIHRFSANSSLRTTERNLEEMALFAGKSTALANTAPSMSEVIERLLSEAFAASLQIESPCRHAPRQPAEDHPVTDRAALGGLLRLSTHVRCAASGPARRRVM